MSESGTAGTSTHSCPHLAFQSAENYEDDENANAWNPRLAYGEEDHTRGSDEPEVLDPDHPLLKHFQAAIKDHLNRQYNRLHEEILKLVSSVTIWIVFARSSYASIVFLHLTTHTG
jgi:hypothetical protein